MSDYFIKGGNVFLGQYEDGRRWMFVGDEEKLEKFGAENIANTYGIAKEEVHFIPNQNYHLDMFMRPVGYPYVLVNDEKLVAKYLNQNRSNTKEIRKFKDEYRKFCLKNKKEKYVNCDVVCARLKELGFIPVRVPAVWGYNVNFMNAIVNRHSDGTISYIAPSSKCKSEFISNLQNIFENELRQKLPYIDKVYFIEGTKDKDNTGYGNKLMQSLGTYRGGLHCLSLEEPDFEIWA